MCVCECVCERESEGEGMERVCEGERKIIFSNLLPLFFSPLVSLLFSKALCSVKHSFFLLLGKMETRRLAAGRGAGKDFSLLFPLFPSRLDAAPCPAVRRHPNPVTSRSSWLSLEPSGDLFFARFLAFGAAARSDPIRSVLALPFPPSRSVPAAASRDGHGAFWGCAEPWAVGPVGAALRGVVF